MAVTLQKARITRYIIMMSHSNLYMCIYIYIYIYIYRRKKISDESEPDIYSV